MLPIDLFLKVWARCDHLSTIHSYVSTSTTSALNADELLRSEWVARVSALDLFVHELVTQRMLSIFDGSIETLPLKYSAFKLPLKTVERLISPAPGTFSRGIFELEVRSQLSKDTFQMPEAIADAVRCCSGVELWNEIALELDANVSTKNERAKGLKRQLALIIERRNKIAHEGDIEPSFLRSSNPITRDQLESVSTFIRKIVESIDKCVAKHDFPE
jgi:RiboL-PSP-HEPN